MDHRVEHYYTYAIQMTHQILTSMQFIRWVGSGMVPLELSAPPTSPPPPPPQPQK